VLVVEGLVKRFGGFTAVSNVSFKVDQGEILGLIGPNGSGKSTIFNMLSGTFAPTAGSIAFELAYFLLLTGAYAGSELSLVYPIARGLAPVVVLVVAVLALSADLSLWEGVGVAVVASGVFLVRGVSGGDPRGILFGVAIACCIAGYTIVQTRSRDEALEWSHRFPNPAGDGGSAEIEVRQMVEHGDFCPSEAAERFRELGGAGNR